jgi:hypothetical protein
MAAFLSGEMKDTVQMNPAGDYGAARLYFQQECADGNYSSVGAILFKKGASEIVPQLGRECQHVGQGSCSQRSVRDLD